MFRVHAIDRANSRALRILGGRKNEQNRHDGSLMTIGGKTTISWKTVVRLSLLLPLAVSISACYSRPLRDKPMESVAPAPEQALPVEAGRPAPGQPVDEVPAERADPWRGFSRHGYLRPAWRPTPRAPSWRCPPVK